MKSTAPMIRLAEHVVAHGDGERDVLAFDPLLLLRVDALQVQVADAVVMAAEEGDRVAAAIGMMARVEAERHPLRVGLLEERLDLVLVLDVRLGVRVVDQLQAEAARGQVGRRDGSCRSTVSSRRHRVATAGWAGR